MARTNPIEKNEIPELYRSSALNLLLFAYIRGVKRISPSISVDRAAAMFLVDFDLDDGKYNIDLAETTYSRMQKKQFLHRKKYTNEN